MNKIRAFLVVFTAILSIQTALSQNNTNSPYTRFGYGEISNNTSGAQRGMGGIGIAERQKDRINTMNPASYSSVDSLTFMFDIAVSGLFSHFNDNAGSKNTFNGNLEYVTLKMRLFKGVGFSAGLLPYSFAGYNYNSTDIAVMPTPARDTVSYKTSFYGTGGFSEVYAGLSVDLFKHVSLGANMYYMFGSYDNIRSLQFASTSTSTSSIQTNSIKANNLRFRFGLQLYNTFAEKHDITLGGIYEMKSGLNGKAQQVTSTYTADTVDLSNGFELPQTIGGGLFYKYDNKFSVGVDYTWEQWSKVLFYGTRGSLEDSWKLAAGFEYQNDFRGRKYSDRMIYRFGLNMSKPYYKVGINDIPGKNYGVSMGVGLPLRKSRSMINMALEYGRIASYSALKEDYFKLTVNLSLVETWFMKRKL